MTEVGGVGPIILVSLYLCPTGTDTLCARCFATNAPIIVIARRQKADVAIRFPLNPLFMPAGNSCAQHNS